MEPRRMSHETPTFMASGLSDAVQGYPALPFVLSEMKDLSDRFHGRTLMNRDFLVGNVQREFTNKEYSIVHIASHGEFDNDVRKTFVLTYDDHLSLDMIERLIRPAQLRDKPVEMLSLSACQTAAGDDRAALGLAGVAVKAGARSAFATLWYVNDEASTILVSEFYAQLFDAKHPSKAQALRSAQMKLLADPRNSHPCLWAPYLIIGNWL
jgi:CHAT domain-containing protein